MPSDIADAVMNQNAGCGSRVSCQKADVNAAQPDGTTALHWAARWDDLETAQLLIRAGADARAANHDGATPMFLAAQNGSAAMIELLLKAGADVNAPVLSHGETALMMASRSGSVDAVKMLLDHGAADQRQRHFARNHGADVGRRTGPHRGGGVAGRARAPTCARNPKYLRPLKRRGSGVRSSQEIRAVPTRPSRAA